MILLGEEWQGHAYGPRRPNNRNNTFNGATPGAKEVNVVDVSSRESTSGEEVPRNYKPAEYLSFHKK